MERQDGERGGGAREWLVKVILSVDRRLLGTFVIFLNHDSFLRLGVSALPREAAARRDATRREYNAQST